MSWSLLVVALIGCSRSPDVQSYERVQRETAARQAKILERPDPSVSVPSLTPMEPAAPKLQNVPEANRVLVVANETDSDSMAIAKAYLEARKIPKENLCFVSVPTDPFLRFAMYSGELEPKVRRHIAGLKWPIDYIVLTRGIPLKYSKGTSVDAGLSTMDMGLREVERPEDLPTLASPYFKKDEPFSRAKFGFYLVTRLDGYTREDALKLIANSIAARPNKGPFLFDQAGNRKGGGYGAAQNDFVPAEAGLRSRGFETVLDTSDTFAGSARPLAGYVSWGSNDGAFNKDTYRALRFLPGAIAETFVSTSARNLVPDSPGQSQIGDLIRQGVTGVKGYVNEPYLSAMAVPSILFDRYTRGYNLAESYYMASPFIKWRDVIFGDPLCRPYPKVAR